MCPRTHACGARDCRGIRSCAHNATISRPTQQQHPCQRCLATPCSTRPRTLATRSATSGTSRWVNVARPFARSKHRCTLEPLVTATHRAVRRPSAGTRTSRGRDELQPRVGERARCTAAQRRAPDGRRRRREPLPPGGAANAAAAGSAARSVRPQHVVRHVLHVESDAGEGEHPLCCRARCGARGEDQFGA